MNIKDHLGLKSSTNAEYTNILLKVKLHVVNTCLYMYMFVYVYVCLYCDLLALGYNFENNRQCFSSHAFFLSVSLFNLFFSHLILN